MRYISKHEADVYLDKEKRSREGGKEAFLLQVWTSLVSAAVETESHVLHESR